MAAPSQTAVFARRVRDLARPAPYACRSGIPVAEAVAGLSSAGTSSLLVLDGTGSILGIVTERDVTRRAAFRLPPDDPVDAIMTRPVVTAEEDEYLYRAVGRMRRLGLRHMPVVDRAGRPVGMRDLHAALAAASQRLVGQIDRLTNEASLEGFARTKAAQIELARGLLADHVPAPEIQALISDINNDIYRRVLRLCVARMAKEGRGEPPVPFACIVMGSGRRGESFLFPDQDNGFVLAGYPDERHGSVDPWFIELASWMTTALDGLRFPLCKGGVMATNPVWRKTLPQWREQVALWMRAPVETTLLYCIATSSSTSSLAIWGGCRRGAAGGGAGRR